MTATMPGRCTTAQFKGVLNAEDFGKFGMEKTSVMGMMD